MHHLVMKSVSIFLTLPKYIKGRNFGGNLIWRIAGKIKFDGNINLAVAGYFWPKSLSNKQKKPVLRPEIAQIWAMEAK